MTDDELTALHKRSYKCRAEIGADTPVGCFFCMRNFVASEITEWVDDGETPLCPRCGIDSVIPNETNKDTLRALCERYFTGRHRDQGR